MDKWPLGNHICIPDHKTINERKYAAILLRDKFQSKIPIVLDTMSNTFDLTYAIWPERYYIVNNGIIYSVGMPTTEFGYDRKNLEYLIKRFIPQE